MQRAQEHPDDLLTVREAAAILSRNAGREINPDYVRSLASSRYNYRLTAVPLDGRTRLYRRSEVEAITISTRPGRKKSSEKPKQKKTRL